MSRGRADDQREDQEKQPVQVAVVAAGRQDGSGEDGWVHRKEDALSR